MLLLTGRLVAALLAIPIRRDWTLYAENLVPAVVVTGVALTRPVVTGIRMWLSETLQIFTMDRLRRFTVGEYAGTAVTGPNV